MKNKLFKHKPKRTTFLKMFAKAMIFPVVFTLIFSFVLYYATERVACEQAQSQQDQLNSTLMEAAVATEDKNDKMGGTINTLRMKMCLGTYYNTLNISEFFGYRFHLPETGVTSYDKNGKAVTAIIDKDGNVVISNAAKMFCVIKFDENNEHNKWLYCDPEEIAIPELQQLIKAHLDSKYSVHTAYSYDITSAYVDLKEHKMIPHVIQVKNSYYKDKYNEYFDEAEERGTEEVVIDVDSSYLEDYELMEFAADKYDTSGEALYPRCTFENIWGIEKEKVDEAINSNFHKNMSGHSYVSDYDLVFNESMTHSSIIINGEKYTLFSDYKVNVWTDFSKKWYGIFVTLFFLLLTFITFLICWRKNVKNKAQYAFEDYQRALTNNLAHDLKTPLAVIGGYAENLMEMRKDSGDEKELKYLDSIMQNVSYTDNIIAKTLKLSETEQIKKLNRKKVDIKALAEKSAEKYRTALEERSIDLKTEGKCEVNANEDTLMTAVENLVSNAVKYTRDGGSIKVTADKKRLSVVNDVSENISTKDLLMPFVKGDKARSDKTSSGLGLAIASAAAAQNGFTLKIDCKDKKFSAFIEF
ncbi:HAMP domain-containing sensor histidine kinase [uncultured Ruminococcus sp.]|uniref:sensor histidine kinase n=1 Tax=uncultured Ruminococcus sp. TaxID=165186 RepID=UPI0025E609A7|nr:HAMP domain-containing sensor histidine kinase [uncultured Ruminococcus sp.]